MRSAFIVWYYFPNIWTTSIVFPCRKAGCLSLPQAHGPKALLPWPCFKSICRVCFLTRTLSDSEVAAWLLFQRIPWRWEKLWFFHCEAIAINALFAQHVTWVICKLLFHGGWARKMRDGCSNWSFRKRYGSMAATVVWVVLVLLVVLVASVVMFEPLTEAVTPELFRTRVLNIFSKGACMLEIFFKNWKTWESKNQKRFLFANNRGNSDI